METDIEIPKAVRTRTADPADQIILATLARKPGPHLKTLAGYTGLLQCEVRLRLHQLKEDKLIKVVGAKGRTFKSSSIGQKIISRGSRLGDLRIVTSS